MRSGAERRPPLGVEFLDGLAGEVLEDLGPVVSFTHDRVELEDDLRVVRCRQVGEEGGGDPVAPVVMRPVGVDPAEVFPART